MSLFTEHVYGVMGKSIRGFRVATLGGPHPAVLGSSTAAYTIPSLPSPHISSSLSPITTGF